ncbi:hypothetical protein [Actinomadura rifamycini]|uniref:hypothetical protein n=1 Tax=Actinomadura rifamycini TaxID=31962 RepID=UPI0012FA6D85|nr:hypothetical protein [Actinomadura rifamycini]
MPSPADSGSSPFAAPWYVDYSPYTMMFIGYVDVRTAIGFAEVGGSLRDHASGLGWRIREAVLVPRHAKDEPRLVVESGTPGYGARIVDVPTASVPLRVGIFASSPCLRHPEARTDR